MYALYAFILSILILITYKVQDVFVTSSFSFIITDVFKNKYWFIYMHHNIELHHNIQRNST